MSPTRWMALLACLGSLCLACAGGPPTVPPGSAAVWGRLELVPREGVPQPRSGGGYGDRRLQAAELVDYSTPGFAVVYVEGGPDASADPVTLRIEDGPLRPTLMPRIAVQRLGAVVRVENRSARRHTVSSPQHGLVTAIDPGAQLEIELSPSRSDATGADARGSELGIYLLDVPSAGSRVFVAPGPFSLVSRSGRYELLDLEPGPVEVRAWHPRFPPLAKEAELHRGSATRLDLEMGVSVDGGGPMEHVDVAP